MLLFGIKHWPDLYARIWSDDVFCRFHNTVRCMVTIELMSFLRHQVIPTKSHCELFVKTLK